MFSGVVGDWYSAGHLTESSTWSPSFPPKRTFAPPFASVFPTISSPP